MNSKAKEIMLKKKEQEEAIKAAEEAKAKIVAEDKPAAPKNIDDQIKNNLAESIANMTSPPEPVKNIFAKKDEAPTPKAVKTEVKTAAETVPVKTEPVAVAKPAPAPALAKPAVSK